MPPRARDVSAGITGGVDLSVPPRVKFAVLDALNMESDGAGVRTRDGYNYMSRTALSGTGVPVSTTVAYYPSDWGGQSVCYVAGKFATAPNAGDLVFVIIGKSDDTETAERGDLSFAYWNGTAWATLEVDVSTLDFIDPLYWPIVNAASDISALLVFIAPDDIDWNADPVSSGTSAGWIRVTRSSGTCVGHPGDAAIWYYLPSGISALASRPYAYASRSGGREVAITANAANAQLAVVDVSRPDPGDMEAYKLKYREGLSYSASDVRGASMVYVAGIDALVACVGDNWIRLAEGAEMDGGSDLATWALDSGVDTAWEDVPTRGSLPRAVDVAVYNQRVFVLTDDGRVLWSAPSEFADIFPEENAYRLPATGRGNALAVFQGAIYVFTERGIFRGIEGTPTEGQDSLVAFTLVEDAGCAAGKSVATAPDGIFFISHDGIRKFNGQFSRIVGDGIQALFDPRCTHTYAVRRPETFVGAYDASRQRYIAAYSLSDSQHNDAALVYCDDERSAWIWGPVPTSGMSSGSGQRSRGFRATGICYSPLTRTVIIASSDGTFARLGSAEKDAGSPIQWKLETHHIGGGGEAGVMKEVRALVEREHFKSLNIAVVGDGLRVDTKEVSAQRDGLSASGALGSAALAGQSLVADDSAYVPAVWRGAMRARNHRIRLSSASPSHAPFRIAEVGGVIVR